jgi:hypothetical protein
MDRELLAHFLRARHKESGAPDDHAVPVMAHIVERLSDHPAMVFSRFGEVLLQTRPAAVLFGDYTRCGGLELYRQVLVDPVECQLLLVFTAIPHSPSDEKLRRLAAAGD